METAKVDIRKLQLLNDRINQCIDALNQVRLSVHGLSGAATGQVGIGVGQSPGFENVGLSHTGFGQNPFAQQAIGQQIPFGGPNPYANPYAQIPGYFGGLTPGAFPQQAFPQQGGGAFGFGVNPLLAGLTHTSPEALGAFGRQMWVDPLLTARIVQTFPYAQLPVPPVVTIY